MRIASVVVVAGIGLLLAAPAARGGGWATVKLSSTPDGVRAGQAWVVDVQVLQHGTTPLEGVRPSVRAVHRRTSEVLEAPARPTERAGVYRARVVFPHGGRWRYAVDDGFSQRHAFGAVRIAAGDPAAPSAARRGAAATGGSGDALASAVLAGLLAAGLAGVALRRRRRVPGAVGPG